MVDTSAWIEFLRATESPSDFAVTALLELGQAAWCDMVLLELANGGNLQQKKRLREISSLVWMFEIDQGIWKLSRTLATRARAKGVTTPAPDILISACARAFDLEVLHHRDPQFDDLATIDLS